jgi:hypothetical protein
MEHFVNVAACFSGGCSWLVISQSTQRRDIRAMDVGINENNSRTLLCHRDGKIDGNGCHADATLSACQDDQARWRSLRKRLFSHGAKNELSEFCGLVDHWFTHFS